MAIYRPDEGEMNQSKATKSEKDIALTLALRANL